MFLYKNTSRMTKTFHGVTFRPGETHSVTGYINDPEFIRVNNAATDKPATKDAKKTTSSSAAKTSSSSTSKTSKPVTTKSTASNNEENLAKKEEKSNG